MTRSLIVLSMAALAGCVHHDFVPGPGASNPNTQMVSGQCKLAALNGIDNPEFFAASGSPKFVAASTAGYAVGSAIGKAVKTNAIYNACMEANGYVDAPVKPGS